VAGLLTRPLWVPAWPAEDFAEGVLDEAMAEEGLGSGSFHAAI
jgi:hypothetical protein